MSKYAMVWTTNRNYMPGTNASLNAMEHYGFKDVDVFILSHEGEIPKEYKDQWPSICFDNIMRVAFPLPPNVDGGWNFVSADLVYALELLKVYEVVLLWGADLCVLDDFTEYFEIAEKLGAMVLGTNEHGTHYIDRLDKTWPYGHTWSVPYADVPFFVPWKWSSVLDMMLDYYYRRDNPSGVDRMDGLNYAVRDVGARVHGVPGELWVANVPYRLMLIQGAGQSVYINESSTRLKSFHRKYWNAATCREYLPGGMEPYTAISRRNKLIFNSMYNFFNTACRVKWTEGLEVWDGA